MFVLASLPSVIVLFEPPRFLRRRMLKSSLFGAGLRMTAFVGRDVPPPFVIVGEVGVDGMRKRGHEKRYLCVFVVAFFYRHPSVGDIESRPVLHCMLSFALNAAGPTLLALVNVLWPEERSCL